MIATRKQRPETNIVILLNSPLCQQNKRLGMIVLQTRVINNFPFDVKVFPLKYINSNDKDSKSIS
jgi:hypothetical protein